MQIHEKVKAYIDEHHMKQISVAHVAGIANITFNAMLNGKKKMYAEDLRAVCWVLGVSADIFIERKSACPQGQSHLFGFFHGRQPDFPGIELPFSPLPILGTQH